MLLQPVLASASGRHPGGSPSRRGRRSLRSSCDSGNHRGITDLFARARSHDDRPRTAARAPRVSLLLSFLSRPKNTKSVVPCRRPFGKATISIKSGPRQPLTGAGFAFRMATLSAPSSSALPSSARFVGRWRARPSRRIHPMHPGAARSGHPLPTDRLRALAGSVSPGCHSMLGGSTRGIAVSSRIDDRLLLPGFRDGRLLGRL